MSPSVGATTVDFFTLGVNRRNTIDSASHFSGAIDETSIFKRALSNNEIKDIFGNYRANGLNVF